MLHQTWWNNFLANELITVLLFLGGCILGGWIVIKFIRRRLKLVVEYHRYKLDPKQKSLISDDESLGIYLSPEEIKEQAEVNLELRNLIEENPEIIQRLKVIKKEDGTAEIIEEEEKIIKEIEYDAVISWKWVLQTPKWFSPMEVRFGVGVIKWDSFEKIDRTQLMSDKISSLERRLAIRDKDLIQAVLRNE